MMKACLEFREAIKDFYLFLLRTGRGSDCHFLVGTAAEDRVVFRAHSKVLSKESPVFKCMFYGSIPTNRKEAIIIDDIEAADFETLLHFIYSDKIHFDSTLRTQRIYYAASKYMLNDLKKRCSEYLSQQITAENVFEYLKFSLLYDDIQLKENCHEIIRKNIPEVMNSEELYQATFENLDSILSEVRSNISNESKLFVTLNEYFESRNSNNISADNQAGSSQESENTLSIKTETETETETDEQKPFCKKAKLSSELDS